MKLLIIMLFSSSLFAQNQWFKTGDQWYSINPKYDGSNEKKNNQFIKIKVSGDTIILNKSCKVLEYTYCPSSLKYCKEYLHQSNDSIMYFNYNSNTFHLLLNFSAKEGDTVWVHKTEFKPTKGYFETLNIPNFGYVIDSIFTKTVSGSNQLKCQKVKQVGKNNSLYWYFTCGEIYQYIGSACAFFGAYNIFTNNNEGKLLNYKSLVNIVFDSNYDTTCNLVNTELIKNNIEFDYKLVRTEYKVFIIFSDNILNCQSYDLLGNNINIQFEKNIISVQKTTNKSFIVLKYLLENNKTGTIKIAL